MTVEPSYGRERVKLPLDKLIPGRCVSCLLFYRPRGLVSCMAFLLRGWKSCTLFYHPDFIAKTKSPSVHDPRFEGFTVPSMNDFVDSDRDEALLCPIRALRKNLART